MKLKTHEILSVFFSNITGLELQKFISRKHSLNSESWEKM